MHPQTKGKAQNAPGAHRNFQISQVRNLPGYLHGRIQRLVLLEALVDPSLKGHRMMSDVASALAPFLGSNEFTETDALKLSPVGGVANLQIFCRIIAALQHTSGAVVAEHPFFDVDRKPRKGRLKVKVYLPTSSQRLAALTVEWLDTFATRSLNGELDSWTALELEQFVENAITQFEEDALTGFNTRFLMRAAVDRRIPTIQLPSNVFQYGYGQGARLFQGARSDETSALAESWTKSKVACNTVLKGAMYPVPLQAKVNTLEHAKQKAREFGFPVVLKPWDLDNGKGVFPGITDDADLEACFEQATRHSQRLILEKHIPGETYRVVVVKGRVVSTWYRKYASVTGDGSRSIEALISEMNAGEDRSSERFSDLRPIAINAELENFLKQSGRTLATVPGQDEVVRVGRNSNWSQGGDIVPSEIPNHPDNDELFIRIAELLNLDVAGIDFIVDRIDRSWKDGDCAICEVNAQPELDDVILDYFCFERAPVVLEVGSSFPSYDRRPIIANAIDKRAMRVSEAFNASEVIESGFPLAFVDALVVSPCLTIRSELQAVLDLALKQGLSAVWVEEAHPLARWLAKLDDTYKVRILANRAEIEAEVGKLEPVRYASLADEA